MTTLQEMTKNDKCHDCNKEISRIITGRNRVPQGFVCDRCHEKRRKEELKPETNGNRI